MRHEITVNKVALDNDGRRWLWHTDYRNVFFEDGSDKGGVVVKYDGNSFVCYESNQDSFYRATGIRR
jgi:hypothetical protein